MVQEYVSPVRVHKYPFEMVMAAYERRFPSCPQIPVVLECVITEDSWTADDSTRYTTRRCQLNVDAPYLLKKMIGVDYVYFIQKNHLDLKSRVLEIEATNETFSARVGVVEKCRYYVHPENPEWTCFEQSALLDVKNFFGLESTVEKIAMKQYSANIAKGKELIESFMDEVLADGVRDLKPWEAGQHARNRELRRVVSRGTEPLSPLAAPDSQRHSQPGTSRRTPKPSTISMKQSSKNLNTIRSKSATKPNTVSSHELSHLRHRSKSPSHKKLEVLGTPGEQGVSKKDQHPTATRHRHSFDGANKKMSTLSIEKKRVTLSEPNLPVSGTQSIRKFREFKPCDCDLNRGAGFRMLLSPWNYLLVVVVFVVMLGLLLSMPLSLVYGNNPDRM